MGSSWIIWIGPKSNGKGIIRDKGEEIGGRQRLEWCSHKPRNTYAARSRERRGREEGAPLELLEEYSPADALIFDFWTLELREDTFLLFKTTKFIVICYNNLRKPISK